MPVVKIVSWIVLLVYLIVLLVLAALTKKPFKALLFNALSGIFLFAVIDLTSAFSGLWIPVNEFTAAAAGLGGVPGILLIIAIQFLFLK